MLTTKLSLPSAEQALPGRESVMPVTNKHYVNGAPLMAPYSAADNDENGMSGVESSFETLYLGLGCFWGAERKFWEMSGVISTAVGYMAGITPNPTYEEVCSGLTGHNEVVKVVYDRTKTDARSLLSAFFEMHDPTQGMRQGNDRGTQYRSGIYVTSDEQRSVAQQLMQAYQIALHSQGYPDMTTELMTAPEFYYAEDYHQQYLAKNPNGYCGIGGTGVTCPL